MASRGGNMPLSLAEIVPAVELFGQPREDDTFDPPRFVLQYQRREKADR